MLKKIKLGLVALLLPLIAFAQSYPSPTFNNLTVNGTFTATGKVGLASLAAQAANTVVANVAAFSASPTAVALPSCSTGASALNYTSASGFTCNTAVNAAQLGGATFASPGPIGSTTASTGAFTTLNASSTVSGSGFSTYLASPPAIGGTSAAAGSFTTLSASSAVSGTGFSTYLASPPAIGGTAAAAGTFTALTATTSATVPNASSNTQALALGQSITAGAWSDVTASRSIGSTFTNSTGRPIMVSVTATNSGAVSSVLGGSVGGTIVANSTSSPSSSGAFNCLTYIVPAGSTYAVSLVAGGVTLSKWFELR